VFRLLLRDLGLRGSSRELSVTRSWSEKTALEKPNEIAQNIKKLKNLTEQLKEVEYQTSSTRRAPTMYYANLVGTTTQRRKRSRSASRHLLLCRQPPRSTTTGSATSRTATGARTVLQDARLGSAEAPEPWAGSRGAT